MSSTSKKVSEDAGNGYELRKHIGNSAGKLLGEVKVKPQAQERLSLGSFAAESLKGFSVEITPNPDPENAVVTQIANTGTKKQYKLLLHVINYGTKTVTAKIWQL